MKNSNAAALQTHTENAAAGLSARPPARPAAAGCSGDSRSDPASHILRFFAQRALFPIARKFIAGQTLKEALDVITDLNRRGFSTSLDHLGESVVDEAEARAAAEQYIVILRALKERGLDRNVSVKPTQLGLVIHRQLFAENLQRVITAAEAISAFVRVDMEDSSTTTDTLAVIASLKQKTTPVGAVLQAMLRRTPHDVVTLLEAGVTMRLCKGAYKESATQAFTSKIDVDRHYVALMKRLLTSGLYHGIATHDTAIIAATQAFAAEQHLPRETFEFQMLYGVRCGLQEALRRAGWRVRIYVPFGRAWLPYMVRRLRERKENVWFVVKNLWRK